MVYHLTTIYAQSLNRVLREVLLYFLRLTDGQLKVDIDVSLDYV